MTPTRLEAVVATHIVAVLLATAGANAAAIDKTYQAIVQQPRPFGHVVGDVLTQRVLLADADHAFEPASLPAPSRLGAWLERRASRLEQDPDGKRWLAVDYQLVNAPPVQATVRLPAWELASRIPGKTLRVAAWSLGVAALAPKAEPGTPGWLVRPDRAPPPLPVDALWRQLLLSSVALAVLLAAWLAWWGWRTWRAAETQPFATALRQLRRLDVAHPAAYQALHGAFDRTAGEVVRESTLPRLFQRAPHLAPLQAEIGRFYAQSASRFFGDAAAGQSTSFASLCAALRRLERRHER
jgi:mxaA protein